METPISININSNINIMKNILSFSKSSNRAVRLIAISCAIIPSLCYAQVATTTIDTTTPVMSNAPLLLGISFDARTSLSGRGGTGQIGYYNTNGTIIPGVDAVFNNFPMSSLRYPANAVMQGFDWKKSIGPIATRTPQGLFAGSSTLQVVEFGFDEFMAMTAAKGVNPKEVQIMVTIYDSLSTTLTSTQMTAAIPNVVRSNADWVEYANAPNDGSNPGGGVDWAAIRAANGHPLPYGIKIWNMGNEPWSPNEFDLTAAGCTSYLTTIGPIIDSMLAIDPTIKITLATVGSVSSAWNTTIMNSSMVVQGKIYGLSPHYFPSEVTSITGTIPLGVAKIASVLPALAATAQTKGLTIIVGDYAHGIPLTGGVPTGNPDLAMQWQGANLCADFLLMMSQINNIERANFWVYGYTAGTWHPIRKNSDGTYTSMPAAEIYKKLNSLFLDNSIAVTNTSPAGSDGNAYAVRSGAFASNNLSQLNVISVNRDKNDTHSLQVNGVAGYNLANARLLTAAGLTADVFSENIVSADSAGNFSMPAMSVLLLQYVRNVLPIQLSSFTGRRINANTVQLNWTTISELNNFGFYVQRRIGAQTTFSDVNGVLIPGHGTTNVPQHYAFTDSSAANQSLSYRLRQVALDGTIHYTNPIQVSSNTSVDTKEIAPLQFALLQNYPNPFNPTTTIRFQIADGSTTLTTSLGLRNENQSTIESRKSKISLKVFDVLGREVATLVEGDRNPGVHLVLFDAKDLPSGVYLYRLTTADFTLAHVMVLAR